MALIPRRNPLPPPFGVPPWEDPRPFDVPPWEDPFKFQTVVSGETLSVPHHAYSRSVVHGSTATEWIETPDAFKFKVHLPGLTKSEVKLEIEDGRILCISVEKVERQQNYSRWNYVENMKSVIRVELPQRVKLDKNKISASMEKEELTVTIPKKEMKKDHYCITIPIIGPRGSDKF